MNARREPREIIVKEDTYRDSASLMMLTERVKKIPGLREVAILMGTPANRERLFSAGFDADILRSAGANDLCIALVAANEEDIREAREFIDAFLAGESRMTFTTGRLPPRNLASALKRLPDANLVMISVPGEYAAAEARKALEAGLHVFLFSDNVSIEDECELKTLAWRRGLLLMGPGCGTAVINGQPLGFSNHVRPGPVGIVTASGTGAQEVMCLLSSQGVGVSHVIGTGGRDLQDRIGGVTFRMALEALRSDYLTKIVVVVSKPPSPSVEAQLMSILARFGKPVVVSFVGRELSQKDMGQARGTSNLAHAASVAAALANGIDVPEPLTMDGFARSQQMHLSPLRNGLGESQRFVRGLFAGGTLADEAAYVLSSIFADVHCGDGFGKVLPVPSWHRGTGHTVFDLGDDRFTRGRPHPMIDPGLRCERIIEEAQDPSVAVMLLDVVLGYNVHDDPAGSLLPSIRQAQEMASARGRALPFVAHVCGTEDDPQKLSCQVALLERAGVKVFSTNVEASLAAAWVAKGGLD